MMELFPFLEGNEKNTLFIMGNGFDLCHGVMSKYKHFCCWLNLNGHESFVDEMQHVFQQLDGRIDTLWCNFETALGGYDHDQVYLYYYKEPVYSSRYNIWEKAANDVVVRIQDLCAQIHPLMKEWVRSINISHVTPRFVLPIDSKYLTFNYTKLLEEKYGVPSTNICHIHGCLSESGELVTGHDNIKDETIFGAKSDEEEKAKQKIIRQMNRMAKNKTVQYEKNKVFFNKLSNIKHVVVIGHSLSDIDLHYFGKVLSSIKNDAIWHFSIHSEDDRKRINVFKIKCKQSPIGHDIEEGDEIKL